MITTQNVFMLLLLFGVSSASGQSWDELADGGGDAPDGVPANQTTVGPGFLTQITGQLDRGSGDHVDTYAIIVDDPNQFFASTAMHLGGGFLSERLLGNTRLWMWRETNAEGTTDLVLANDDDGFAPGDTASTISDPSTFFTLTGGLVDPSAVPLMAGETYLLSISTFDNDPEDSSGVDLADLSSDPTGLVGPDPAAGPFAQWENGASDEEGPYRIALQGARYAVVPEPASGTLLMGLVLGLISVRRRIW